jgi:cell wall-associated NlpC family hydrolase
MTTELQQRAAVVREALPWERTPYRSKGRLKGIAADCGTFLHEVFARCGVLPATIDLPALPPQWFLNRDREWYIEYLSRYFVEYSPSESPDIQQRKSPQPGDVVAALHGRVYSHGAIVVAWPEVIHCFPPCVMRSSAIYNPVYAGRKLRFFDPWGKRP